MKGHIGNFGLGITILLALSTWLPVPVDAESIQEWVARYNGPGGGQDQATALVVDSAGNVYVTGFGIGSGTSFDYTTLKYNPLGQQLWVARYDGPASGWDQAFALAVDDAGYVYVTGFSDRGSGNYDYLTLKYDSLGNEIWQARYNGPGNAADSASAIRVDSEGNVYVTGASEGGTITGTYLDYATLKYNSAGQLLWVARYNGPGNWTDFATDLDVDPDGNVLVTGTCTVNLWEVDTDFATLKYNPSGQQQWVVRYDGPIGGAEVAADLLVDTRGDAYVTGSSEDFLSLDYATVKYSAAGAELWSARYNGSANGDDQPCRIVVDPLGSLYVTGWSEGSGTGYDYATLKYSPRGEQLWVARYNGPGSGYDVARDLALDDLGNLFVTGESDYQGGSYENVDYTTVKYNTNGQQKWVARYDGPGVYLDDDRAVALAVDNQGFAYVTGQSWEDGNYFDFATVKYYQVGSLTVTLSPPLPPTVIPASGGTLEYNIALFNDYDSTIVCDVWCDVLMPDSSILGPVVGPFNMVLPAGFTGDRDRTQIIPATAPPGVYLFKAYIGIYPDSIASQDYLVVVKLTTPNGIAGDDAYLDMVPSVLNFRAAPNPFNATTVISFELRAASYVSLLVFDTAGRLVTTLVEGMRPAGSHQVTWNAAGKPSGLYFCRFQSGEYTDIQKMVLLK